METVSAQLRVATAEAHRTVESELRLVRDDVTLDDYRTYLQAMWAVHASFEVRLGGLTAVLPDAARRQRAQCAADDLRALGLSEPALAGLPTADLGFLDGLGASLGALYVLEGSTLGAKVIRRHLHAVLGTEVPDRYLAGYDDVGAMWKTLRNVLDDYGAGHPDEIKSIVAAANDTFRCVRAWLGGAAGRAAA